VQQSVRLVNQLLTLSAAQSRGPGEPTQSPVALDAVVRQAMEALAGHAHAKDIDLGFEMVGQGPSVAADDVGVREIAMNLIENAIRYTPPGGVVTCRISAVARTVQFTVEDNGPGIPVAERERVFERFYRIYNGDSGGSGLGLPIVRELADRLHAAVALRTPQSGHGLAVDVTFVRANEVEDARRADRAEVLPS
jgi:two-component system sensor histidine kinase TctE